MTHPFGTYTYTLVRGSQCCQQVHPWNYVSSMLHCLVHLLKAPRVQRLAEECRKRLELGEGRFVDREVLFRSQSV